MVPSWPPKLIFNTDGHWIINYQERWEAEDITSMVPLLASAGVDALAVLIGIDDDLSWRRSPHGELWGDHIDNWNPDMATTDIHGNLMEAKAVPHIHGRPIKSIDGVRSLNAHEFLHKLLCKVINDGRDLMQIYCDAARRHSMDVYASFRMNDAHACDEARGWYGRSRLKTDRPDLLLGSPVSAGVHGEDWSFSWRWNYAKEEVRERFLGLFDETLGRWDFDGLELDFSRAPPFFRHGEVLANIPAMTDFMRRTREVLRKYGVVRGRPLHLIVRVPVGLGENLETGLDVQSWIRQCLPDIVVLGSPGYCVHEMDIGLAVEAAGGTDVRIFTGFDGSSYGVSPQEGYERHPASVLCATALNGYREGVEGVHVFNYDYPSHRAGPSDNPDF